MPKFTATEKALLAAVPTAILSLIGLVISGPILDSQNPRTVTIDATSVQYSLPPAKGAFAQQQVLTDNTAPTGDFEVVASTPEGKSVVLRVDDSLPRWWKEQRRETYGNLQGARKKSVQNGCNIVTLSIIGSQFNLPILGKRYPVLLSASLTCPSLAK